MTFVASILGCVVIAAVPAQTQSGPGTIAQALELRIALPFAAGSSYVCGQGNHGKFSHSDEIGEYAFDFTVPEGTPVMAAASGRVVRVKMDSTRGGPTPDFVEDANFVLIDHGGGLYTTYAHLQVDSALVRVGELVNAGMPIAKSGNTGFSQGPHLHFAVTDWLRHSKPSRFVDVPGDGIPQLGATYTSHNDGKGLSWFDRDSDLPADAFGIGGITLASRLPASVIPWSTSTTVRGTVTPGAKSVVLFFSHLGQDDGFACSFAKPSKDGTFELTFTPAAFANQFTNPPYCIGLAPVGDDGRFQCKRMPPVMFLDAGPDDSGKRVMHVGSPFPAGARHAYEQSPKHHLPGAQTTLAITMPENTEVRPVAAGRVIAVGKDSERPGLKTAKTQYVTVDHGAGVWTDYSGLLAKSIRVQEGEIVHCETRLGASVRPASKSEPSFYLGVRTWGDHAPSLLFDDAGGDGELHEAGELNAEGRAGTGHLFTYDSQSPGDVFSDRELTLDSTIPLSTYSIQVPYRIAGTSTREGSEAAFLVRRRSESKFTTCGTATVKDGKFDLGVRLSDFEKALGSGPFEWSVGPARDSKAATSSRWLPLVIVR